MLICMGPLMPSYSFSLFLPTIISNTGFTTSWSITKNQLLSVPPYAGAAILTVVVGYHSDKHKRRGIYNMYLAPLGIAGFIMLIALKGPAVQYGTFLGALGIYASIPTTIAWRANNFEGVYKRGIVLGFVIGWGNLNGVVSSNIFNDSPRFYTGHATVIAYLAVGLFGGSLLLQMLVRENKVKLAGKRDYLLEGKRRKEAEMLRDERLDFLYTL